MKFDLYFYRATLVRVYDGDTFWVNLDMGCNKWWHNRSIRLCSMKYGPVDTPEIRGDERAKGIAVRDLVKNLLGEPGSDVVIRTMHDESGKYGRLLADVVVTIDGVRQFLGNYLVEQGMATVKPEWT